MLKPNLTETKGRRNTRRSCACRAGFLCGVCLRRSWPDGRRLALVLALGQVAPRRAA